MVGRVEGWEVEGMGKRTEVDGTDAKRDERVSGTDSTSQAQEEGANIERKTHLRCLGKEQVGSQIDQLVEAR